MSTANFDFELAMLDPKATFETPETVLADKRLTDGQKVAVLRGWEYDAIEKSVAEEEGMTGREPSMLQRVQRALETLGDVGGAEKSSPTKHG
ncbi:MAG: hypothetical protein O3B08_03180 [Proteobacteria bacterium]|jgi:hypothetical protein|nr:hypothetical protein [Pseudomonadota bacterium]